MPGLIPMIRAARPGLPIIYRSHIEIRSDLCSVAGSPQEEVWQYLWNNIKLADMFIAHPVSKFVPRDVPNEKLALLGAATDWYVNPLAQLSSARTVLTQYQGLMGSTNHLVLGTLNITWVNSVHSVFASECSFPVACHKYV